MEADKDLDFELEVLDFPKGMWREIIGNLALSALCVFGICLGSNSPETVHLQDVPRSLMIASLCFLPCIVWFIKSWPRRDYMIKFNSGSVSRLENQQIIWTRHLFEVSLRFERGRKSDLIGVGTWLGVYDNVGTRLGRFSLANARRAAGTDKEVLARIFEAVSEVVGIEETHEEQRAKVFRIALKCLGSCVLLSLSSYFSFRWYLDGLANNQGNNLIAILSPISAILALSFLLLGLIDLQKAIWFKPEPNKYQDIVHAIISEPTIRRADLVPGLWHKYRNLEAIKKSSNVNKIAYLVLTLFFGTLVAAIVITSYRDPTFGFCFSVFFLGTFASFLGYRYASALVRKTDDRFKIEGNKLIVESSGRILIYPDSSRRCGKDSSVVSSKREWMRAYDYFGRWPNGYPIDLGYVQVDENQATLLAKDTIGS